MSSELVELAGSGATASIDKDGTDAVFKKGSVQVLAGEAREEALQINSSQKGSLPWLKNLRRKKMSPTVAKNTARKSGRTRSTTSERTSLTRRRRGEPASTTNRRGGAGTESRAKLQLIGVGEIRRESRPGHDHTAWHGRGGEHDSRNHS